MTPLEHNALLRRRNRRLQRALRLAYGWDTVTVTVRRKKGKVGR